MDNLPRGIRNNNPGNIEKGERWQGLAADQSGDKRFAVFTSPEYGIRALHKILQTYQSRHNLYSVGAMINRWAPPVENHTGSYVNAVAAHVGVQPYENIDVMNPEIAFKLTEAIIQHENGMQPYDKDTICTGLRLAGVNIIVPVGSTEGSPSSVHSSLMPSSLGSSSMGGLVGWLTQMLSRLLRRR